MGKKLRCLSVQFNDVDIRMTWHAIQRFQERVENLSPKHVPSRVARMLRQSTAVLRSDGRNEKHYFSHESCIFVMTQDGVIVTVLSHRHARNKFAPSVKALRKRKRSMNRRKNKTTHRSRNRREPKNLWEHVHDTDVD